MTTKNTYPVSITRMQPIDRNQWERSGIIEYQIGTHAYTGHTLRDYLDVLPDIKLLPDTLRGWEPYTRVATASDPQYGDAIYFLVRLGTDDPRSRQFRRANID